MIPMTSILETAQQVVALDQKQFTEDDPYAEYDQQYQNKTSGKTALAAALVEAELHMLALINICTDLNVHVDIGEDMNSEELARMYKLKSARAFLSRISKEQDNG